MMHLPRFHPAPLLIKLYDIFVRIEIQKEGSKNNFSARLAEIHKTFLLAGMRMK
jgi:hypothetical protein